MMKYPGAVNMVETFIGKRESQIATVNLQKFGIDVVERKSSFGLLERGCGDIDAD